MNSDVRDILEISENNQPKPIKKVIFLNIIKLIIFNQKIRKKPKD